ncbi:2-polyprenyl-6-methoxyphenol hydroxylase-like FAD-dependent oxidoreductase [Bradyrhizobium japonicum]|jgi:2-polyprenyl-6-methoxyphenol hydroxylase-like FAD-dependent oxidoreductase|uniref:FAD-dependent oxidoreductase n=1 Tax=Bradyrhizobium TaxID=374 RepID=UPI00035F1DD6|nr:NAD(P)/FAD-dependent oxidoreductase [Bradyrhizobium elkanii]MBP2433037.1 2-polyprenyl-6-methoxyphenol hydroxylase-like FAD-dependent oxidoreductase [Bradyrhizobium elkanii]MCP1733643.1 2-polyprenyl-6-methoxyphenol hydroxylase-like FAD-dependent oxidoreductase [Bradyrhizobium elkanii]MCS3568980.1 2-polyprenyl-6-methoxyphenol hydroxylase-like FAD-dependent oxidoreductase [Bradyrhizobium elkanii]MCS3589536.1 2-polyprenyl-6-methoxyphenol hydroxylase-like FAD-dependent oxidoreductase [Bradyrhizob
MIAEKSATKPIVACEAEVIEADVAIVGAGLAGSLARAVLARAGYRVILIDKRSIPPDEFRVEKIAGRQIDILRRLGFIDDVEAIAAPYDRVLNIRSGKLVDIGVGRSYGISYANLVNMARGLTPDASSFLLDQVTNVSCSEQRQQLTLASGRRVVSRLVILATGMTNVLGHSLGIRRRMLAARHSVSFGFTIARPDNAPFDFDALTCYGEEATDGVDYLSLFPMSGGMRANLFMFRDPTDPIMRELRRDTRRTLLRLMPGLQPYLGDFEVVGQVQNWVMDLTVTEGHLRPGVVLIGDAFQTNCPAAGTGVGRLLVDVERLCTDYVPRWLETAGMGVDKIAQFYSDRDKLAADQHSLQLASFRQALTLNTDMRWNLRRKLHFLRRMITHRVDRIHPGWVMRVRSALR